MSAGLSGHIARAGRIAQKRGQKLSTTHVMLSLLQADPDVGPLLIRKGVTALALHETLLTVVDEEPLSAVEVAVERASKLATSMGEAQPLPMHLLIAIAREPRASGHLCLQRMGGVAQQLVQEAKSFLETGRGQPEALQATGTVGAAARFSRQDSRPTPATGTRKSRGNVRRSKLIERSTERDQVALAAETEFKLGKRAASTPAPLVAAAEMQESVQCPSTAPAGVEPGVDEAEPVLAQAAVRLQGAHGGFALDPSEYPILTSLGRNLTALAADGAFDPVIGRDQEIEQLLDVLSRRRANNPLLVGPPGVGKTAVVEGLSRVLAGIDETSQGAGGMEGKVLIELSPGALLSGTGVRGALSERVAALRAEVAQAQGRVVVFFDEIHMIVGNGEGPDSLGNELKTALSRGELPCIGATTDAEYRRGFERDAALARRFTRIEIEEPCPEVAEQILRGVARCYELHHMVAVAEDTLSAAVKLSVRYLADGQLPDKAIGVLDQAAARVRRRGGSVVGIDAVAEVVAERSAVPVDRLLQRDGDVLLGLEERLTSQVRGQAAAVTAIARSLRRSAVGFAGRRPLGTFLFLGSTGVGKTEMAKAIGTLLFPGTEIVRIDMSELSEAHGVARLLGAPPGYIGHDDGGQLTEPVRMRPYRLVLLDEVEKAHPEVLLSLLPLLDEGRLSDGRGRLVDFTNTVIVMTSNLGVQSVAKKRRSGIGFGGQAPAVEELNREQDVLESARKALPPELWNRIDDPLYFQPLGREVVAAIAADLVQQAVATVAASHGVEVRVEPSAIDALIAAGGFDPELGARPMKRTVARLVEASLANSVLDGSLIRGARAVLRGSGKEVFLEPCRADILNASDTLVDAAE